MSPKCNKNISPNFAYLSFNAPLRLFTVPLFSAGDSRDRYASIALPPSWFVKASAIWGECLNYRGEGSGVGRRRENFPSPTILTPTPASLGSLDTLHRSRSLLQTKMAAVRSKRTSPENPTEKWGDCEQSTRHSEEGIYGKSAGSFPKQRLVIDSSLAGLHALQGLELS